MCWHDSCFTVRYAICQVRSVAEEKTTCQMHSRTERKTQMNLAVIAAIYSSVGWVGWIIIGGIAGWLAGRVMRGSGYGLLGDIVVGIIGGIIGGIILGLLVTTTVGFVGSL